MEKATIKESLFSAYKMFSVTQRTNQSLIRTKYKNYHKIKIINTHTLTNSKDSKVTKKQSD